MHLFGENSIVLKFKERTNRLSRFGLIRNLNPNEQIMYDLIHQFSEWISFVNASHNHFTLTPYMICI